MYLALRLALTAINKKASVLNIAGSNGTKKSSHSELIDTELHTSKTSAT